MKIFIFEDDISISLDYEMILDKLGLLDFTIFKSIESAEKLILDSTPDLVILDIYLKDGIGLDLLPLLNKLHIPTIVVSAYTDDKFTSKALEYQAEAFLAKPVNPNTLKFEIKKIQNKIIEAEARNFIFVMGKNKLGKIRINEIEYLITEGNYTSFITKRKKYVVKKSLTSIMNQIDNPDFCKIFRNIVVNIDFINSIDYSNNTIITDLGHTIPLGNTYKNDLKLKTASKFKII